LARKALRLRPVLTDPFTSTLKAGQLQFKRSFSVFSPGHIDAIIFNCGGVCIAQHLQNTVRSAKDKILDSTIAAEEDAARIALKRGSRNTRGDFPPLKVILSNFSCNQPSISFQ
jgi:hypothetical protein